MIYQLKKEYFSQVRVLHMFIAENPFFAQFQVEDIIHDIISFICILISFRLECLFPLNFIIYINNCEVLPSVQFGDGK